MRRGSNLGRPMMKPNDITPTKSTQISSEKEGVDTGTSPVTPKTPKGHDPERFRHLLDDEKDQEGRDTPLLTSEETGEAPSLFKLIGAMNNPVVPKGPKQPMIGESMIEESSIAGSTLVTSGLKPSVGPLVAETGDGKLKSTTAVTPGSDAVSFHPKDTPHTSEQEKAVVTGPSTMSVRPTDEKKTAPETHVAEEIAPDRPVVQKVKEKEGSSSIDTSTQQMPTAVPQQPVTIDMIGPRVVANPVVHSDMQARIDAIENIEALARQMVDAMTTSTTKETTTTTITLKYPPLFEGAAIEVTQYAQSPKDLNVTFHNLTPDARAIIEMVDNQAALRQNLIDKGYTLQLLTVDADVRTGPSTITTARSEGQFKGGSEGREKSTDGDDSPGRDKRFA